MQKLFFVFLFLIFLVPTVAGEIYQQHTAVDLRLSVSNNGSADGVTANITVRDPDNVVLIPFLAMSNQAGTTDFNYTISSDNTSKTGTYSYVVCGFSSDENECNSYTFEVTPSGVTQTSILENPMILVLGILGTILVFVGLYMGNPWFGFIGSIIILLGGIYTMIYGFNNQQNLYTQGIALVIIGVSIIFMFISALEFIWRGGDED